MASVVTITVFLLCCFLSAPTDSWDGCDLYGATGDNIVVPLNSRWKERSNLRWRHNDKVIFNQKQNLGSKDMVYPNGSLKLTSLKKSDSGNYIPEVFNKNGQAESNLKAIRLCVLDRVQKPVVRITCLNKTDITFICNVTQKNSNLEYKWLSWDKELKGQLKDTLTTKAKEVLNISFACKVSNLISSEISDPVIQECVKPLRKPVVTVMCLNQTDVTFACNLTQKDSNLEYKWFSQGKELKGQLKDTLTKKAKAVINVPFACKVSNLISSEISDPVTQECVKPFFPDEIFGVSIWFFVGGGIGLVLVLCIIITICCIRTRRKRRATRG